MSHLRVERSIIAMSSLISTTTNCFVLFCHVFALIEFPSTFLIHIFYLVLFKFASFKIKLRVSKIHPDFTCFVFFDTWYIIKHLFTGTSGKQYVFWSFDLDQGLRTTKHTVSLGPSK